MDSNPLVHQLPILPASYSGLTIILDHPSRHDTRELISGFAGQTFNTFLLPVTRELCDVRSSACSEPLLKGTKVVLLLGEDALRLYRQNVTLNDQRGCPFEVNGIIFIATYAPQDAFDRKNYDTDDDDESDAETTTEKSHQKTKRKNFKFWLYNDCKKAVRILKNGLRSYPKFEYIYYPSASQIIDELTNTKGQYLMLDIETDRQQNLTCFGFSFLPSMNHVIADCHKVYVVPFKRYNGKLAYEDSFIFDIVVGLAISFRDNVVVAHNGAGFDFFVMAYKYRIPYPALPYDTMLGFHRCYPEIEKSLGHIISYFTDLPYHKNDGVFDPQNTVQETSLWHYNGKDISTMLVCFQELQKEIVKLGVGKSVDQANASIRAYLTMQYKGVKVDTEKFIAKFDECEKKGVELTKCLEVITGRPLNPRSSQQVSEYLYDDLGLPEPDEDKTNEKQLLKLLTKRVVPSINIILAVRGERKLASSLKFRLWNNGFDSSEYERATCGYPIAGTDTFRLGSRAMLKFRPDPGFGTNMQNWDKKKRYLVIADVGKILGQNDQAGAEALIVAYLCRNGRFRKLFTNKIKPHVFVALHLFADIWSKRFDSSVVKNCCGSSIENLKTIEGWKELEQIIKDSDNWAATERYYYIAKQTCHSSNYGIKAPTFQMNVLLKSEGAVALPLDACKKFLGLYHELFPEIQEWHCNVQEQIKRNRRLNNLFGFQRIFHAPFGEDLFKQAYAFIPQSTVGSITNIAASELQAEIDSGIITKEFGFDLLQNGHDSLLWQCNTTEEVISCSRRVKVALEKEFVSPVDGVKFRMGSECSIGSNWMPYSEKKNPSGLKEIKL